MKARFSPITCDRCGQRRDPMFASCPNCGQEDPHSRGFHDFDHQVRLGFGYQLTFVLMQTLGIFFLTLFLSLILRIFVVSANPGAAAEEIAAELSSGTYSFILNIAIYLCLAVAAIVILAVGKKLKEFFRTFVGWKGYVAGLVGGAAIFAATFVYGLLLEMVFQAIGVATPGPNQNELAIREMTLSFPVLSLIVFGFVGPLTEEVAYRVGCFSFLNRLNKWFAYLGSAILFGLVHFNFNALFDPSLSETLIVELANLPSYLGAGLALAFLYDRFGLAASYTAHTLNNVVSLTLTLAGINA